MKIAIVDMYGNTGGGQRFTGSMLRALSAGSFGYDIRFISSREAIDLRLFGDIESLPIEISSIKTEATLRRMLPDGRVWGVPGTWRLKALMRQGLQRSIFHVNNQLKSLLQDVDLAYFPWPDFSVPCNY